MLAAGSFASLRPTRVVVSAATDSAMIVPEADRAEETARLRALGAKVPEGGLVLERPWDPPFTRRSYIVPQSWFAAKAPDSVSADALALDLPILKVAMERAYGGWETAKRRGWNWDKWFDDWTASLHAQSGHRLPLAEAFAPMKELMAFQLDNHTTIPLRGARFGSASRSIVINGSPTSSCTSIAMTDGRQLPLDAKDPSQRPRRAKRWDATTRSLTPVSYIAIPANRGTPASIHCGAETLTVKMAWPSNDPTSRTVLEAAERDRAVRTLSRAEADEPLLERLDSTVAYLRLPTFSVQNGLLIEQRLPAWPKPNGADKVLIVDLRDNSGGNAALEALRNWVDVRRTQRAQAAHRHQGASCLYEALRWGYMSVSTLSIKPPVPQSMTQRLQTSLDPLFKNVNDGCPSRFDDSNSGWDYRQHAMRPLGEIDGKRRIVVLVNNGTASDGEYMTLLLSSLGETVVVGTNTYGVAQYVQPGYSVLPHTRIPFRIALGTSDNYGDDRSFDGYGLDVDILLSTQDDQRPENIIALAKYLAGM